MKHTVTMTGMDAVAMRYALSLAKVKFPELSALTDSEIIERLIERASSSEEVRK